jgi:hypothetical protein
MTFGNHTTVNKLNTTKQKTYKCVNVVTLPICVGIVPVSWAPLIELHTLT